MTACPSAQDPRKCFLFCDDRQEWKGPYSAQELLDLIKAGVITMETPIWDQLRASGMAGEWLPAWQALGFAAEPSQSKDPWQWKPAEDLSAFLPQNKRL
jgi:hypothetical protein